MRGRDRRSSRTRRRGFSAGVARHRGEALNDFYQDAIIAAARRTSGVGRLAQPHGSATIDNPLCGDRVTIDVEIGSPGRIAGIGHETRGCLLCEAAAVLIAEQAPQRHIEELLHAGAGVDSALLEGTPFPWRELEMFAPVRGVKSRHRCVGLPFEALHAALGSCTGGATRGDQSVFPARVRAARCR